MTYEFQQSLKLGDAGEESFHKAYPHLIYDSCEGHDFVDEGTGKTIELKTDFWSMSKTQNFFMEMYSDDINYKLGGPFRSQVHGTDVFAYYFISEGVVFWFDNIEKLTQRIHKYVNHYYISMKTIPNRRYNTLGYAIPRLEFFDLYKEFKIGDPLPL